MLIIKKPSELQDKLIFAKNEDTQLRNAIAWLWDWKNINVLTFIAKISNQMVVGSFLLCIFLEMEPYSTEPFHLS